MSLDHEATLREHLEAIRGYYTVNTRANDHATAALAILREARATTGRGPYQRVVLIPDPLPRAASRS